MGDPRKALLVIFGVCAAAALLVMLASRAGASRPSVEYSGAAPRSSGSADYAVDVNAPILGPLDIEVVSAAGQDRQNLGLPPQALAAPPRLGATMGASNGQGTEPSALAGGSSPSSETFPPAAPIGLDETGAHSSLPVVPILITMTLVGCLAWGACYVLRPRES